MMKAVQFFLCCLLLPLQFCSQTWNSSILVFFFSSRHFTQDAWRYLFFLLDTKTFPVFMVSESSFFAFLVWWPDRLSLKHPFHAQLLWYLPEATVANCTETPVLRQDSHSDPHLSRPSWPGSSGERLFPCCCRCQVNDGNSFWHSHTGSALTRGGSGPSTASPRCLFSWTGSWWTPARRTRSWRKCKSNQTTKGVEFWNPVRCTAGWVKSEGYCLISVQNSGFSFFLSRKAKWIEDQQERPPFKDV